MDCLRFINSKDICAHLEKIGYEFSSLEAAWLIYQCRNCTMAEKHAAWCELIETMPDCRIEHPEWKAPRESLHQFLRDYMALEEYFCRRFCDNTHAVYVYREVPLKSDLIFASVADLLADANKRTWFREYGAVLVQKRFINDPDTSGGVCALRADGAVMNIDCPMENEAQADLFYHSLDWLSFVFPVPFTVGDILWDPMNEAFPCVPTPDFYTAGRGANAYDIYAVEEGKGEILAIDYLNFNYMNFEYYPPERLVGWRRVLGALSSFLKGEIDGVRFARLYHRILLQQHLDSSADLDFVEICEDDLPF